MGEARNAVEDEQKVTLVGTIGGSSDPFVDGLAAFTIVDSKCRTVRRMRAARRRGITAARRIRSKTTLRRSKLWVNPGVLSPAMLASSWESKNSRRLSSKAKRNATTRANLSVAGHQDLRATWRVTHE